MGRAHEPSFRLVLTHSENSTKSGRFKEVLGNYDPRKTIEAVKSERIKHWLGLGALATPTVHNLLVRKGVIRGKKIHVGMDNVIKAKEGTPVEEVKNDIIEEVPPTE